MLDHAGESWRGNREYQEDSFSILDLGSETQSPRTALYIVADGMGGHAGGAAASSAVIKAFTEAFVATGGRHTVALRAGMEAATKALAECEDKDENLRGLGSTLVAVVLSSAGVEWLSVGDSPLWLVREGKLSRLNADHSMKPVLDRMAETGEISREEAAHDPQRHQLRSALTRNAPELVDVSDTPTPLKAGDVVVLASDGMLTLTKEEIAWHCSAPRSATDACRAMIEAVKARDASNQDNATVVALRCPPELATAARVDPKPSTSPPKRTRTAPPQPAVSSGGMFGRNALLGGLVVALAATAWMFGVGRNEPVVSPAIHVAVVPPGERKLETPAAVPAPVPENQNNAAPSPPPDAESAEPNSAPLAAKGDLSGEVRPSGKRVVAVPLPPEGSEPEPVPTPMAEAPPPAHEHSGTGEPAPTPPVTVEPVTPSGSKPSVPAPAPALASLLVETNPPDANLFVDGKLLGASGTPYEFQPGSHVLEVRRQGFVARKLPISAEAGKQQKLNIELCRMRASVDCRDGDVWRFDSCGTPEAMIENCKGNETCADGSCVKPAPVEVKTKPVTSPEVAKKPAPVPEPAKVSVKESTPAPASIVPPVKPAAPKVEPVKVVPLPKGQTPAVPSAPVAKAAVTPPAKDCGDKRDHRMCNKDDIWFADKCDKPTMLDKNCPGTERCQPQGTNFRCR